MKTAAKQTNINVRIDPKAQAQASLLFSDMGLDEAAAIELFYRQVIAEHRLPFQPIAPSVGDRVLAAAFARNTPTIRLNADENGNIIIDENTPQDVIDWIENG